MRKIATMKAKSQQVRTDSLVAGDLVQFSGEWLALADAPAPAWAEGTFALPIDVVGRPYTITLDADTPIEAVRPEAVRLSKAQAEFLRLVAAGRIHFAPSNHDYVAPSHAHRDMFTTYKGGRKSNRTLAGEALFQLGLINIDRTNRKVLLTKAAERWLAAHPA